MNIYLSSQPWAVNTIDLDAVDKVDLTDPDLTELKRLPPSDPVESVALEAALIMESIFRLDLIASGMQDTEAHNLARAQKTFAINLLIAVALLRTRGHFNLTRPLHGDKEKWMRVLDEFAGPTPITIGGKWYTSGTQAAHLIGDEIQVVAVYHGIAAVYDLIRRVFKTVEISWWLRLLSCEYVNVRHRRPLVANTDTAAPTQQVALGNSPGFDEKLKIIWKDNPNDPTLVPPRLWPFVKLAVQGCCVRTRSDVLEEYKKLKQYKYKKLPSPDTLRTYASLASGLLAQADFEIRVHLDGDRVHFIHEESINATSA